MKYCKQCDKDTERYNGKVGMCKACDRRRHQERRKADPEKAKADRRKHYHAHREKILIVRRKWEANNEKNRKLGRRRRTLSLYGLSLDEYAEKEQEQGSCCAICKQLPKSTHKGRKLHIDHCHETGKVRALLCIKCNLAVGLLNEDKSIFSAAIEYLNKFKVARHLDILSAK